MVLNGKYRTVFQPDAAICPVKQADMGFGNRVGQCFAVDGEAVIHRGNLNLAGFNIFDRMIGTMMALFHFLCLRAQRQCQHLMAEAYAENRQTAFHQRADLSNRISARGRRVAGAV